MCYKEKRWIAKWVFKSGGYLCVLNAVIVSVGFVTRGTFLYHALIKTVKLHLL